MKQVSKWSVLRKLVKQDVYTAALLCPRPSDTGFATGWDAGIIVECGEAQTTNASALNDEQFAALVDESQQALLHMAAFVKANDAKLPLMALPSAASTVNNVMLALLTSVSQSGDKMPGRRAAAIALVQFAASEVESVLSEN